MIKFEINSNCGQSSSSDDLEFYLAAITIYFKFSFYFYFYNLAKLSDLEYYYWSDSSSYYVFCS